MIVSWFSVPFHHTLSLYDQQAAQPGMSGFISNDEMEANKKQVWAAQWHGLHPITTFSLFPLPFLYYISVFATVCMCVIWGCSVCMSIKRRANWGHWWCTCWSREMEKKIPQLWTFSLLSTLPKNLPPLSAPLPLIIHYTTLYTLVNTHTHINRKAHMFNLWPNRSF